MRARLETEGRATRTGAGKGVSRAPHVTHKVRATGLGAPQDGHVGPVAAGGAGSTEGGRVGGDGAFSLLEGRSSSTGRASSGAAGRDGADVTASTRGRRVVVASRSGSGAPVSHWR